MNLGVIPESEIERAADLAAKHARERALLEGKHENERRELQRRHQEEAQAIMKPPAEATPAP